MTRKEWLVAAILALVTVCAWVIFDIIHTRSQVEVPKQLQDVIEPINPNFDIKDL
ncbi:hypothetical protein M1437_02310 [Patescibacteria group bacterium]|nr:hypothetical protein [Patescibacteria group bacterium]